MKKLMILGLIAILASCSTIPSIQNDSPTSEVITSIAKDTTSIAKNTRDISCEISKAASFDVQDVIDAAQAICKFSSVFPSSSLVPDDDARELSNQCVILTQSKNFSEIQKTPQWNKYCSDKITPEIIRALQFSTLAEDFFLRNQT